MATFPTVKQGSQGTAVKVLQMNLIGLGYTYNGVTANGIFDSLTNEVTRDFQAENKLVVDGVVGPITWGILLGKITDIQSRLNAAGFNSGIPDGIFGSKTTDATRRFQIFNGITTQTQGVISPRTRQQLYNPNPVDDFSKRPSSNNLNSLHPYVANLARQFINICSKNNITITIVSAFRSWDEQDTLYAQGRTKAGYIVTDAEGGGSYHNWGLAFDCAPIVNGAIAWDDTNKFMQMGELGQQIGLEWGGNWTSFAVQFVDLPHYQYNFGLSIEQLLNGKRPPVVLP